MTSTVTREIKYIRLPEQRIKEIEDLVSAWPFETKAFMHARLNQFNPATNSIRMGLRWLLSLVRPLKSKVFKNLKDPDILTDWQKRFRISGQTNPQESWNKILQDELSEKDYIYLKYLLKKDLTDVHVPGEIVDIFENVYRAHLRKEYLSDPAVPAAPLLMIIGPSGSGKTSTTRETVEKVIFGNEVKAEIDLKLKKEELLADKPFWKSISEVDEDLYLEMIRRKKLKLYKRLSTIPLVNLVFRKSITKNISSLEETGIRVDYQMITPNDYRTALAGEPGNYFKKAMGNPTRTSIRHVEEAHSAFGRADSSESGVESQQRTLIDTSNIIIDEIINGRRDCLLIATTDQPERCDSSIYRRFVEKGKIIDISSFWKEVDNLREVVRLELIKNDVKISDNNGDDDPGKFKHISYKELDLAVSRIYKIFDERSLKLTPSYVRKLIKSIVEIKQDFKPECLEDSYLVRQAFELVAKNSYGDLFEKVVDRMDRKTLWETYVGSVKYTFSEMANNCLFYGVDEEKGVVLSGPPGSGKTFLVRSWLSENSGVHDISTSPGALRSSANPIDGAVENLEKVYDIAKMIAPTLVFFDEGDSLAPRRSSSGGSPTDKLTNKFLNIIDGEIPLNRVFTVLTTNRLDILDPALIRSKRLKAMEITGVLKKQDISEMITFTLKGVPLADEINEDAVMEASQGICDSPADYAGFIEKARTLRKTEYEVLVRFREISKAKNQVENFVKLNFKTLKGILNALEIPAILKAKVKKAPQAFLENLSGMEPHLNKIKKGEQYPLVMAHLNAARREISLSPVKKGKVQLDEFLEAELSQEPQVGFIIGVGASDTSGVLLPIATSLIYNYTFEKIMVTGAVSSSASAAVELDMAVQMMQQSAKEALTMVENYLQSLLPKFNIARIIGDFLNNYTIHHQLLSASYNVGGPSAGYALAVNTLSVLLNVPVYHDFGITGAPWTKGVRKGEVGSPVIIGGHKKKTEKVLLHLRRMYMPKRNYDELQPDYLAGYWSHAKDILAVTNFGDLVPEVIHFGKKNHAALMKLIDKRIAYKLKKNEGEINTQKGLQAEIIKMKRDLSKVANKNIVARLQAIQRHVRNGQSDPDISMSELFHDKPEIRERPADSLKGIIKRRQVKDFIPSALAGRFFKRESD
jgi:SpoVK/Ycf46/Vps4 family AAA+-type ATPase